MKFYSYIYGRKRNRYNLSGGLKNMQQSEQSDKVRQKMICDNCPESDEESVEDVST